MEEHDGHATELDKAAASRSPSSAVTTYPSHQADIADMMKASSRPPSYPIKRGKSTDSDSELSKPLLDNRLNLVRSVICRPSEDNFQAISGLVHCAVSCHGKQIDFQIQHPTGEVANLMTATRGKLWSKTRFVISLGNSPIASLVEVKSTFSQHTYALEIEKGIAIAYILYCVPKLKCLVPRLQPRKAEVALFDEAATTKGGNKLQMFQDLCHHRLFGPRQLSVTTFDYSPSVVQSVEPHIRKNGRYGLDFKGRGRCASRKNMQLVMPKPNGGKEIVLQMAKWDDNVYHVDFKEPVMPLQAFGWALAQIDLK